MSSVVRIAPEINRVQAPTVLRQIPSWCVWKYEWHDGETKPRKVPYWATGGKRHGKHGSPEDRAKLVTFAAARDAAARMGMSGVGLALLPDWGVTALDFDHCVDASGNVPDEIAEIVSQTYAEYSPSGEGVRAFVLGDFGNRKAKTTELKYGFETFSRNGFVTFTGNVLPLCDVLDCQDVIARLDEPVGALCEARFGTRKVHEVDLTDDPFVGLEPVLGLTVERMEDLLSHLDADVGRDDWIRVGMALHHECEGDDTGFELWNEWSENGVKYPGREALEAQWESFTRRAGDRRKQVTMATVIRMANEAGSPDIASEERLADAAREGAKMATGTAHVTPPEFDGKFRITSADTLANREPPEWWIKGFLPKADLGTIYGASGSGKSFLVIDLMASVALGIPWRERRVQKGRVLYIAAEGGAGVGKRFDAYCRHHDIPTSALDIGIITVPPNFMDAEDITELVKAVAAAGGFDLIVVDTYAQVTPGANENAADDMGRALANCRALRNATGAMILLVHHEGKDASKGARGWSGLRAAVDVEIGVTRHEDGKREVKLTKLKDGEDGVSFGMALTVVQLGVDVDGDEVTSCVVEAIDVPVKALPEKGPGKGVQRYGKMERHVLEIIELEYAAEADASVYSFVDRCVEALAKPEEGKRDNRRFAVQRALTSLAKRKDEAPIAIQHGRVIFCI